jgi:hypothetical protein
MLLGDDITHKPGKAKKRYLRVTHKFRGVETAAMRKIETLWIPVGLVAILAICDGFADEGEWNELNSERNR